MSPQDSVNDKIILLVEGEPDDELMTLRVLEKAGIKNEVVVARDGQEALDYLFVPGGYAEQDTRLVPQIVLLEPKLPKLDGLKVLERLRADERTAHLPVAVFASSGEEQDLLESNGSGDNVYIRKPFDFAQFSHAIRQLGLRWLVIDGNGEGSK